MFTDTSNGSSYLGSRLDGVIYLAEITDNYFARLAAAATQPVSSETSPLTLITPQLTRPVEERKRRWSEVEGRSQISREGCLFFDNAGRFTCHEWEGVSCFRLPSLHDGIKINPSNCFTGLFKMLRCYRSDARINSLMNYPRLTCRLLK